MQDNPVFGVGISNYAIFSLSIKSTQMNLTHRSTLIWTVLGFKILAQFNFLFFFTSSRAFSDAARSRFWCLDPKRFLLGVLKMLVLALPKIYTRLFYLWNSIDLNSAWVGDSVLCQVSYLPLF